MCFKGGSFRSGFSDLPGRSSHHFAVFDGDGDLPFVFVDDRADKVCVDDIVGLAVLIEKVDRGLDLLLHLFRGLALKEGNDALVILTWIRLGEIFLKPVVDGDEEFFVLFGHRLISYEVPA